MQLKLDQIKLREALDRLRPIYEKARDWGDKGPLDDAREEDGAALTEFHGFIMRITSWPSPKAQMAKAAGQ